VAGLQPGLDLHRDERAWETVSNTVFFNAIRMAAWNNFSLCMRPDAMGPPSAKPTVRNADVVWLENWIPIAFLNPGSVMKMSFSIAEIWDIRARAQKLH
jgi:hypothetical protein